MRTRAVARVALPPGPPVRPQAHVAKVLVARWAAVGGWRNVMARMPVEMADALAAPRVGAALRGERDEGGRGALVKGTVASPPSRIGRVAARVPPMLTVGTRHKRWRAWGARAI